MLAFNRLIHSGLILTRCHKNLESAGCNFLFYKEGLNVRGGGPPVGCRLNFHQVCRFKFSTIVAG